MRLFALVSVALLVAATGCGQPDDEDNDDQPRSYAELADEVCTHATERPSEIEAALEREDTDPETDDVGETHRHFRILLPSPEEADDHEGWVAFDLGEYDTDEFAIFTSVETEPILYDADGQQLDTQFDVEQFDACPEIRLQHSAELDARLYYLHFPAGEDDEISTITERIGDVERVE